MAKHKKPNGYWTIERVFNESKKYSTKHDFIHGSPSAYKKAQDNGLISKMTWLRDCRKGERVTHKYTKETIANIIREHNCITTSDLQAVNEYALKKAKEKGWIDELGLTQKKHDVGYWTENAVWNVAKKYTNKNEFARKEPTAYKWARKYKILDKLCWMKCPTYDEIRDEHNSLVYAYIDQDNKVAYVGLTIDVNRRKYSHKYQINSAVRKYFGKNIPDPIILKDNLTIDESTYYEDYYKKLYLNEGYNVLNVAPTGQNVGSIGGLAKWTSKQKVFEEAKKYSSKSEFKRKAGGAYNHAKDNNWLIEMTWFKTPKAKIKWTRDAVFEESHKYEFKSVFCRQSSWAYNLAKNNGWLKEMSWLKETKKPMNYWTKERVIEESRKYTNRKDFDKYAKGACTKARNEGWLDEMTWLEPLPLGKISMWTVNRIIDESKKYSSKTEFAQESPTAYKHALEDKTVFAQMPWLIEKKKPNGYWNDKSIVMQEGRKYKSRKAFSKGSYSAWKKAKNEGWIEEMTWFEKEKN